MMAGWGVHLALAAVLVGVAVLVLRRRVRHDDRPIAAAFLVALGLVGFFGYRTLDRTMFWMDAAHYRMAPEPWMTPGFIERSWRLPRHSLRSVLSDEDDQHARGWTLARIARQRGVPVEQVIAEIQAHLAATDGSPATKPPATESPATGPEPAPGKPAVARPGSSPADSSPTGSLPPGSTPADSAPADSAPSSREPSGPAQATGPASPAGTR